MSDIGYGDENDDDVNVLIRQQDATIDALLTRIGRLEAENERLLNNAKEDARWLLAYSEWCRKNGCAPSASDLMESLPERRTITSSGSISMAADPKQPSRLEVKHGQEDT